VVRYSLEIKYSAQKELDALDDALFARIDAKVFGAGKQPTAPQAARSCEVFRTNGEFG
jgi:hypothetical protein